MRSTSLAMTVASSLSFKTTGSWIDRAFNGLIENAAAALVVAEVFVLALGIFFRYVMQSALTWSDELAQIMFIWLAMLGAVIALRRGEHMRMTTFVAKASPARRALLEAVALAA